MADWIGRDLERLRKLRGMRREEVAAQLSLSPSTIRNIEHDDQYNVSLDLLRQIAEVLGATVRISIEVPDATEPEAAIAGTASDGTVPDGTVPDGTVPDGRRLVSNEHFIRLIHERYPECPLTNSQIGRRMWSFAKSRGAEMVKGRKQVKRSREPVALSYRVPTTTAEYTVRERDFGAMERFADRLGRAFKDARGRVLVPIA